MEEKVISKEAFLKDGAYARETYEGVLVSADMNSGGYNIGVQVGEDDVVVVDQASAEDVRGKALAWSARVDEVQQRHAPEQNLSRYSLLE
jgi:hypothetical protein